MRTTTKRGIGRGAALNGNGAPVLPPTSGSAITLYRQPPPPPRSRWRTVRTVFAWAFVFLLMCAGAAGGGAYLWFHESVAAVVATTPEVKVAAKQLDIPLADQPATALVVGYDKRKGEDSGAEARSDTVMLVRADPNTQSISLLSFPRDLIVDVTCAGKPSYRGRINEAYSECGTRGTLDTVRKLTGIPVHYLITVNFRGFRQLVDSIGGIWLDVDRRYFNDRGGPSGYATINLHPGYQRLGGYQALDFVRYRHADSDLYRLARQQLFVRAFKAQIASEFSATTLPRVVSTITKNVEVGRGGNAELDGRTVLRYAHFAYYLPPGHFFQSRIDGLEGYAELTTSPENIARAVQEFSQPDVESPQKATQVALGEKPKATKAPAPRETTITVLNGNGVEGAASTTSYLLSQRGYSMNVPPAGKSADAPNWDYFKTQIQYDGAQTGAEAAAKKVAALFGTDDVKVLEPAVEALANGSMLTVIVGRTFHGTLAEAPVDKTPKRQPPNVVPGTELALPLLRERQPKMPFPLLVPSVVERGSWLDRTRPVRMYRVDPDRKHKALRLVYQTAGGEYWGVQMTDWEDAPVLAERNFYRTIGGRRYELHYNGPKLHMVVLREHGATYWVVNTLLDTLSNETMLAIAKGLKRLPQG
jgi:LCP family protein required for cell wall assembly